MGKKQPSPSAAAPPLPPRDNGNNSNDAPPTYHSYEGPSASAPSSSSSSIHPQSYHQQSSSSSSSTELTALPPTAGPGAAATTPTTTTTLFTRLAGATQRLNDRLVQPPNLAPAATLTVPALGLPSSSSPSNNPPNRSSPSNNPLSDLRSRLPTVGGPVTVQIPQNPVHPSLYPVRGIAFLMTHPQLWRRVLTRIFVLLVAGLAVTVFLFAWALERQAAALEPHMAVWLAWTIAVLLTVVEATASVVVFALLFLPLTLDRVFADTLRLKGHPTLASRPTLHRRHCLALLHRRSAAQSIKYLDAVVSVITLPVNVVPILGQVAYVALNGYLQGFAAHLLYFEMKGCSFADGMAYVRERRVAYTAFGVAAAALEIVPVANCLFVFTNVVGAAMWAADLEDQGLGPVPSDPAAAAAVAAGAGAGAGTAPMVGISMGPVTPNAQLGGAGEAGRVGYAPI